MFSVTRRLFQLLHDIK